MLSVLHWRFKEKDLTTIKRTTDLGYAELSHRLWQRFARLVSRELRSSKASIARLEERNQKQRGTVTSPGGPVVSLTTYGKRLNSVHLPIESIAMGTMLPSRLILWLDDEKAFNDRPETLRRLEARGLEVKLTRNFGPHTKYYPYLESNEDLDVPLVTADDDTLYPRSWLKGLAEAFRNDPTVVSCYRAHVITLAESGFANYVTWPRCRTAMPGIHNFATGVSGVIYPTGLQRQIKAAGLGFLEVCPKADDVWLHVQALRGRFKIKQLRAWEQSFPVLPGTQDTGLVQENVHGSQNDIQIQKTYTAEDIALLRASE